MNPRSQHASHLTICLLTAATLTFQSLHAAESPWTSSNRIAISADGNPDADADDVGATPITLAVLAKLGLQDNLVHYDFNNFLEYKRIDPDQNRIWKSAMGGQSRWGFDSRRFFDAAIDPDAAVAHLTAEIDKSTADDPLYLIAAGPLELLYRALEGTKVAAREHVTIVSHHDYNEYFKPRLWQRNWNDIQVLAPKIGYIKIKDQNGWNGSGLKGADDNDFAWLREHDDPNLNWVYDRIAAGKPDVSDAGMLTWLVGINGSDEVVTIPEMKEWFGAELVPTNGGKPETPAAPAGVTPDVIPPATENVFPESDGRIVIEAASVPLTDGWVLDENGSAHSGSGSIRWMPNADETHSHQHQGVLAYKLRITNAGKYRMALKSAHKSDAKGDQWNGCWTLMGLNPVSPFGDTRMTCPTLDKDQLNPGFTWDTVHKNYGAILGKEGPLSEPLYELTAGDHYFWICGRTVGFQIDKIHFFKEGVSGFKDDTLPATPIVELRAGTIE